MKLRPVTSALYAVLFATAACSSSGELSDKRLPTGSQTLATSSDYSALYVTNTDQGTIGRAAFAGGEVAQVQVGQRPTRIARGGNRVYVTLRGDRQVAVLEEQGGSLAEVGRIEVGAEPYGVVASADGARVYVTVSMEDKVLEIDGGSLAILREWSVPGQPRWVALHPSGESLFVASAFTGRLTWIDLAGDRISEVAIPTQDAFNGKREQFARRMTGDIAISPNGELLLSPALVVDHTTEVPEDDVNNLPAPGGYDAGRFNPVVVAVNLEPNGQPIVETVSLVSVVAHAANGVSVVGYPSSVSIDPESQVAVVTIEGAGAAVAMSIETSAPSEPGVFDNALGSADAFAPVPGGRGVAFSARPSVVFGVPAGPRGVLFAEAGKPSVYSFLDHQVAQLDLTVEAVRQRLSPDDSNGSGFAVSAPAPEVRMGPGGPAFPQAQFEFRAQKAVTVADEVLSPLEAQGRRLFFAANDSKMSAGGSGVSCATCHFDGRNDGLTWSFSRGDRQTPSLAGKVSLQAPVRWEGDRITVADDALKTSQGLMGGQGMVEADAAAIEAFIDSTPDVDAPLLASDAAVLRGKAIFESAEAACATCHNGPRFTDNKPHPMRGINATTRSLVGISASAPYYHDGVAKTLRDVLDMNDRDEMGRTSHLSDAQKDDLVAYLKSI